MSCENFVVEEKISDTCNLEYDDWHDRDSYTIRKKDSLQDEISLTKKEMEKIVKIVKKINEAEDKYYEDEELI